LLSGGSAQHSRVRTILSSGSPPLNPDPRRFRAYRSFVLRVRPLFPVTSALVGSVSPLIDRVHRFKRCVGDDRQASAPSEHGFCAPCTWDRCSRRCSGDDRHGYRECVSDSVCEADGTGSFDAVSILLRAVPASAAAGPRRKSRRADTIEVCRAAKPRRWRLKAGVYRHPSEDRLWKRASVRRDRGAGDCSCGARW
jgi:hypothetical protein